MDLPGEDAEGPDVGELGEAAVGEALDGGPAWWEDFFRGDALTVHSHVRLAKVRHLVPGRCNGESVSGPFSS